MFGMSKTIVGLDVGSYAVKAVALQPNKDRITLQGYAQAKIGSEDPATVVRRVIDQLGVKPRRLVTSVSGRSVIVRQVETPKLGPDELKAHITYEADKYIPFGSDEVIIDCQPLPDRANAKATNMQVLLVAVRRGFVEDHLNMLKSAGIAPEIIDVDVFALSNAYELLGPGVNEAEQGATALIDIGASKSNIAIIQGKRLLFTREVYLAGNEITDAIVRTFNEASEEIDRLKSAPGDGLEALIDAAMPAFEDLANEIRLSFDYVEGQFEQQVANVVLTGGSSQLTTIADILGNILGRPAYVFDPLAGLDLVPSRYDLHGLDANAPSLTVALGLAAHLLSDSVGSLGGGQSRGWQPRADGAGGGQRQAPAAPQAAEAPAPAAAIPNPRHTPTGNAATTTPLRMPVIATPQAPTAIAPPSAMAAPMAPMAMPTGMDEESSPVEFTLPGEDADQRPQDSGKIFPPDASKSGLLVILDDEQEMPPSERMQKGAGKKTAISLENFDEDDGGDKMPNLPKI